MIDSCDLNPSQCLNNGKCLVNVSSNMTYCQCDPCHEGILCESDVFSQNHFDTNYIYFIIYVIGLCFSVLNNGLIFELFIRCRRIRGTNGGIYLLVYSILSHLSIILLVATEAVKHYPNRLDNDQRKVFDCYVTKIGYNTLIYLCIWFSSCIAFERGIIIWFDSKMNGTRWRSCATIVFIFSIAGGSATPLLLYKCDWDNIPNLQIARGFFIWFYLIAGIAVYVLGTLLVLISFARRIRLYGTENASFMKTFLKVLYTHLFFFVPLIAYGICQLPYTIVVNIKNPKHSYFQCGISTGEYIIKVLIEVLTSAPFVVTWLLFVYPSEVYMTEFYLNTWLGQHLAKILTFFKSSIDREENVLLSITSPTNNEHDNREL